MTWAHLSPAPKRNTQAPLPAAPEYLGTSVLSVLCLCCLDHFGPGDVYRCSRCTDCLARPGILLIKNMRCACAVLQVTGAVACICQRALRCDTAQMCARSRGVGGRLTVSGGGRGVGPAVSGADWPVSGVEDQFQGDKHEVHLRDEHLERSWVSPDSGREISLVHSP